MRVTQIAAVLHDKCGPFYTENPSLLGKTWEELTEEEETLVVNMIRSGMDEFDNNERAKRKHVPGSSRPPGHSARKRNLKERRERKAKGE